MGQLALYNNLAVNVAGNAIHIQYASCAERASRSISSTPTIAQARASCRKWFFRPNSGKDCSQSGICHAEAR